MVAYPAIVSYKVAPRDPTKALVLPIWLCNRALARLRGPTHFGPPKRTFKWWRHLASWAKKACEGAALCETSCPFSSNLRGRHSCSDQEHAFLVAKNGQNMFNRRLLRRQITTPQQNNVKTIWLPTYQKIHNMSFLPRFSHLNSLSALTPPPNPCSHACRVKYSDIYKKGKRAALPI